MMYDIAIIGAGPAGATLARLLDRQFRILLVDKRNMDSDQGFHHNKCCGGLLAPDAQKALAQQGLGIPKEIIVGPQMFSVRTEDFDNNMTKYYQRHYINVDRERFDRWLISMIPENVNQMYDTHFKGYQDHESHFEITLEQGGETKQIKTRMLVGADGATSKIRRHACSLEHQAKQYVSIQNWYTTKQQLPFYVSIFDREITDFYGWIIQKDEQLIVGAALKASSLAKKQFDQLTKKLEAAGYVLGKPTKSEGTWLLRPSHPRQIHLFKGHIAWIGEAAGFISPSSAEGISYALRSGYILAESLNRSFEHFGVNYRKKARILKINLWFKHIKSIFMYNRITRMMIMKLGILSMDIKIMK